MDSSEGLPTPPNTPGFDPPQPVFRPHTPGFDHPQSVRVENLMWMIMGKYIGDD